MAKRILREEGAIDRICILVVENYKFKNNITMTDEEFDAKCKSEDVRKQAIFNLNVVDLKSKLMEEYEGHRDVFFCHKEALYIMENVPKELIVNIEEWLDNKPLSDIKIHGVSINGLLNEYPGCFHICEALKCFIKWKETGYENKDFCHWYFSRA